MDRRSSASTPATGAATPALSALDGTPEKTLNLAISLLVAEDLGKAGLKIMMTRTGDTYPTLQERTDMANAAQASLFVSVHNNAGDSGAGGTETFYWYDPKDPAIYSADGLRLATLIQQNLVEALDSVDRGAKKHAINLWVLANSCMTAVLTEVGFMDNAEELANLKTPAYQEKAARAIADGILEFLEWSTTVYTSEPSVSDEPF